LRFILSGCLFRFLQRNFGLIFLAGIGR